jgi:uncharacterized protein (TIGR02145 family)
MDRNLGASRAAISSVDYNAYGCLFQWGRGNDDHASINWTSSKEGIPQSESTDISALRDTPGNALFITDAVAMDWRSDNNNMRWQEGTQINNPCPSGFHVPSSAQITAELTAYNINNSATAYTNGPGGGFRFVMAGNRAHYDAQLYYQETNGYYWSRSTSGTNSIIFSLNSGNISSVSYERSYGFSVRCIKN